MNSLENEMIGYVTVDNLEGALASADGHIMTIQQRQYVKHGLIVYKIDT